MSVSDPDVAESAEAAGVDVDVDVLIVGGGPVGLTARALLERWGVRTLLVEKRHELSPFPRSRLVNTRSMEIFRGLGLAGTIRSRAFDRQFGRIRFRDTLLDQDLGSAAMIGVNAPIPASPEMGAITSQDRLEPTLLAGAGAPLRFGVELIDIVQAGGVEGADSAEESDSVVAVLVEHHSGEQERVRARYVLAADGANSTVRQLLDIGTLGPGALGSFTTVVFDADLTRWSAGQPAGVYFTSKGTFTAFYPEGGWAWFGSTPENHESVDWSDLVSRALGSNAEVTVKVDVLRVQHWMMTAFVAERFQHGRILLAGDAAHTVPIVGGLGMNVGLADVHNLCWKLAGVIQGWAADGMLASYEPERQRVARLTMKQTIENAQLLQQAQRRRSGQLRAGDAASSDIELPWSEQFYAQLGLVLGVAYRSTAVLTDGSAPAEPAEPGTDYLPTAEPGHRMPHLWLAPDRSTLDTFGEWFTLLTATPADWEQPADAPWPLHLETLTIEVADALGLGPDGALLVRPDGYIAARWSKRPTTDSALRDALATITAL